MFESNDSMEESIKQVNNGDADLNDIVKEFQKEAFSSEHGSINSDDKTEDQKTEDFGIPSSDETIEGIPLSDLLNLLPPEYVDNLLSPTLTIYKASLSKNLDAQTFSEVESLLKANGVYTEIKKKAFRIYIDQKYPNLSQKQLSPLMTIIAAEAIQTVTIVNQVNGYLKEKNHLFQGEKYGHQEEFEKN